ncbi:uncharacterized protein LOC110919174 [Helianthus annuus]|uniref:uncharacterized protein LOC110919174 n=1 Tax=Helianthus annuus TaxID=4232 RepID=UPI000B903E37|nr:uncharacterized protein LOC110919174 [Helianthus annuus]
MGVKQGDPLSPFIFILAMEAFSSFLMSASEVDFINGISIPNDSPTISNLIFPDDVLIAGDWSDINALNIRRIMRCFAVVSGLNLNFRKSCLYGVDVHVAEVDRLAAVMRCQAGAFPFIYLGIKVSVNMNKIFNWGPVIELFERRVSQWKASTLSVRGRLTAHTYQVSS